MLVHPGPGRRPTAAAGTTIARTAITITSATVGLAKWSDGRERIRPQPGDDHADAHADRQPHQGVELVHVPERDEHAVEKRLHLDGEGGSGHPAMAGRDGNKTQAQCE